jgi:uncharacterized protein YndB with AHSA1/START domain
MEQQDTTVETSKEINAPVEAVYAAWTEPDQLKAWWKPMNNQLGNVVNELNEGGKVDYQFESGKLHISGEYSEVKPNELLAYSWNWEFPDDMVKNGSYKLTVSFSGQDGKSTIKVLQEAAETNESLLPTEQGWEDGLEALKNYVESK